MNKMNNKYHKELVVYQRWRSNFTYQGKRADYLQRKNNHTELTANCSQATREFNSIKKNKTERKLKEANDARAEINELKTKQRED